MPRVFLLLVPVLALAGAATGAVTRPAPDPVVETASPGTAASVPPVLVIDVAGAVARPGVVALPSGSRVIDALTAAGGVTPDADPSALNKAAVLRDGSRVYVPRKGEALPADAFGAEADPKVDINRASQKDLESLPGVGPATATRIISSRTSKPFSRVEELQTRGLVSARVFADIKELVTVR